jgi:hypothetical protein
MERDRALILTALLAGLRADELVRAIGAATMAPSSTSATRAARTAGSRSSRHWST